MSKDNKPKYQIASDLFGQWQDDIYQGNPPTFYSIGSGELERIEVGPKLITLIGGAPGAGKTAFTMQAVVDALRLTPTLRAVVCNIEMPPEVLLDRQLSRLSGISAADIRYRLLDDSHSHRVETAMTALEPVTDRLCFVRPPFNLENVAAVADKFNADLLVLDYIQRIAPPGDHADRRGSVDATMGYLREFADAGLAVIVVAAVGRQKNNRGQNSYDSDSLSLASFRESSELEFGADDAFILCPNKNDPDLIDLKHLKARHTEPKDLSLRFDRNYQRFTPADPMESLPPANRAVHTKLAALWDLAEQQPEGSDH